MGRNSSTPRANIVRRRGRRPFEAIQALSVSVLLTADPRCTPGPSGRRQNWIGVDWEEFNPSTGAAWLDTTARRLGRRPWEKPGRRRSAQSSARSATRGAGRAERANYSGDLWRRPRPWRRLVQNTERALCCANGMVSKERQGARAACAGPAGRRCRSAIPCSTIFFFFPFFRKPAKGCQAGRREWACNRAIDSGQIS